MDFSLSEEQRMLADLVGRFVEKDYDFDARRASAAQPEGFSRQLWATLAETGLLGLNVPEQHGGMGGSPADTLIVMEAFGRGLVVEPYLSNAVVAARLITLAGSPRQQAALLPSIADGSALFALAALEPGARFDLWHVDCKAVPSGAGWRLDGAKAVVLNGDSADTLIVSARTSGHADDTAGISLFLVDRNAAGVTVQGFPTFDGGRVAEIRFDGVQLGADALLGAAGAGWAPLEHAVDFGLAALCAEAVGAMQRLLDITADYLRTRQQFGKPIGSFQALQHRAAEMLASVEQARSMALMAASQADNADAVTRRRALSAAKSMIGRCGRHVGQTATQLHGGMGMTDEMPCGHYFKRLTGIDKTWGDSDHHAELFAALL
jgi:alkylation response protein AidB-like acyl-CoA dehydrogenase